MPPAKFPGDCRLPVGSGPGWDYSQTWKPAQVLQLLPPNHPLSPTWGWSFYPLHPPDVEWYSRRRTTLPASCWLQAPSAILIAPDGPTPPSRPHLSILVHGMAPEKGNFRGVLAIDLCSDKILVKTPAHSTSQGGVENPLQVLLFSLCKHSQLYMPIAIMSQQLLMK